MKGLIFDFEETDKLETPITRVFLLFKVLLLNLIFGCVFTIICFSVKRSIAKYLSYLCCGFCDDCDCDYDGSHPSRSKQPHHRRKLVENVTSRRNRNRYKTAPCEDTLAYSMWMLLKSFYSNKTLVKKVMLLLVGIIVGWLLFTANSSKSPTSQAITPIYSFSNHELISAETDNPKRVFFVTPTAASGIQSARLTRLAQSLFQSREFVTWVIVSTDPVSSSMMSSRVTEHWEWYQALKWKNDENRVLEHLNDLYETVSRFGIPFVILSAHEIHHRNFGFTRDQLTGRKSLSIYIKACHVGILWATKTFQKGVLLTGAEDDVYNYKLFSEVQGTQVMSTWPTVFDPRYRLSLSTPILRNGTNSMEGYFIGGNVKKSGIPLQYANHALSINVSKGLQKAKQLWKLTFDNKYTSRDLNIYKSEIQILARNCSQLYVWRLGTAFTHFLAVNSQKIPLKVKWLDTNAHQLHKIIKRCFAKDLHKA